jgi:predicted ATP-binding protein involved in virulence
MVLLYLYVQSSGIFNNAEFNFSDKYQFHFDFSKKTLTGEKLNNSLPCDFFKCDKESSTTVTCISAIVGNNGSGKTTVAACLRMLFSGVDLPETSMFLIYLDKEGCLAGINHKTGITQSLTSIQNVIFSDTKAPISHFDTIFYLTNNYTTSFCLEDAGNEFLDLSTSNLLRAEKYDISKKEPPPFSSPLKTHELLELHRNVEFISHCRGTSFENKIPLPLGLEIKFSEKKIQQFEDFLNRIILRQEDLKKYGPNIFVGRESKPNLDNVCNLFLLSYLGSCSNTKNNSLLLKALEEACHTFLDLRIKNRDILFVSSDQIIAIFESLTSSIHSIGDKKIRLAHESAVKLYNFLNEHQNAFQVFKCKTKLSFLKDAELIYPFLEHYFYSFDKRGYIDFGWDVPVSAGEQAQINLYSRIYCKLNNFKEKVWGQSNVQELKHVLLFFDEIEITIHPSLQRRLVENVICFLESFFRNTLVHPCKFQIIFASHSPILLSDIPRSNVIFLKRNNSDPVHPSVNVLSSEDIASKVTFAANIHTLYKDSFFLDDSLLGSFALNKIKYIVDKLRKDIYSDDLLSLIKIIDEPLIRTTLESDFFSNLRKSQPGLEVQMLTKRLNELQVKSGD